jgi:DnaJ-class molecular chaperone
MKKQQKTADKVVKCVACGGTGKIGDSTCKKCNGSGKVTILED